MRIRTLRVTIRKDNPLRKPGPVYFGSVRYGTGSKMRRSGLYVRLGSHGFGVYCR